jgi:hypothetical protein
LTDWRTGGLADWRTGGLAHWRTGALPVPVADADVGGLSVMAVFTLIGYYFVIKKEKCLYFERVLGGFCEGGRGKWGSILPL